MLENDFFIENKLKVLKYDCDYFKKEEKFSKMKLEEKEWFFKDEKLLKRIKDINKDISRFF